jgi:copper binding plastocyanin/azurin family protein
MLVAMARWAIVIIAVLVGTLAGSAHADPPTLTAIVGTNDGFNITLNDASGKKVAFLAPGTYTVVVDDRSAIHNFHLASNDDPTVDFRTDVEFVGQKTFTVTFRNHTRYAYACEPHWQIMNGSFMVTDSPPPPPTPKLPMLSGSVSGTGAVRLVPRVVPAGRVRLAVSDRSANANFHLRGNGVDRRTGLAFEGRKSWVVRLARGSYRFGSDRSGLKQLLRVR